MEGGVISWEVSVEEFRDIFKETIRSLDTHESWRHTGMYVTRAYPCKTPQGGRALRVSLLDGDEWLVIEKP